MNIKQWAKPMSVITISGLFISGVGYYMTRKAEPKELPKINSSSSVITQQVESVPKSTEVDASTNESEHVVQIPYGADIDTSAIDSEISADEITKSNISAEFTAGNDRLERRKSELKDLYSEYESKLSSISTDMTDADYQVSVRNQKSAVENCLKSYLNEVRPYDELVASLNGLLANGEEISPDSLNRAEEQQENLSALLDELCIELNKFISNY